MFQPFDLTPHINAAVATYNSERARGMLNAWGNSFPAEELPFGAPFRAGGLEVGGIPFKLPPKAPGELDSLEPLGQELEVPDGPTAIGLGLLCCGEMGDQQVEIVLTGEGGRQERFLAVAPGVMVPGGTDVGEGGLACSHLHYPGDYDLALAVPALWCFRHRWEEPLPVTRIRFGPNPLFHLVALTFLLREADDE